MFMEIAIAIAACLGAAVLGALGWRERRMRIEIESRLDRARAELRQAKEQRRQAETEAEAQRVTLINSMGEGVLLLDREGRIQLFNDAFERLFDVKGEIRGRSVLEAVRSHELDHLVRQTRRTGHTFGAELELRGLPPRSLEVNAASIAGGSVPGMIFVFHDLTRIRQLENTRKEFVANVSHGSSARRSR